MPLSPLPMADAACSKLSMISLLADLDHDDSERRAQSASAETPI
jgi:hypothetical protein